MKEEYLTSNKWTYGCGNIDIRKHRNMNDRRRKDKILNRINSKQRIFWEFEKENRSQGSKGYEKKKIRYWLKNNAGQNTVYMAKCVSPDERYFHCFQATENARPRCMYLIRTNFRGDLISRIQNRFISHVLTFAQWLKGLPGWPRLYNLNFIFQKPSN